MSPGVSVMAIANVLLVDDEVAFVDTITKRLTKRDLEVTPAYNGKEALENLEKTPGVEAILIPASLPLKIIKSSGAEAYIDE